MEIQLREVPKRMRGKSYTDIVTNAIADIDSSAVSKPKRSRGFRRPLTIASGFALIFFGGLFISWTAHRIDRHLRGEIFLQARMVAQAVDVKSVMALSGTRADLALPGYRRLKEQLSLICSANPKCRFIYLMGKNDGGELFFHVDSEDPDSKDYSPPGEIFTEATSDDHAVFDTGVGNADGGPYKDRWGTWISAMTPIHHPDTGGVLAVLGMDFNADSWKWDVANRTMLPASSALLAIAFGLYLLILALRGDWR